MTAAAKGTDDGGWLSLVGFQGESFFARVKGGSKLDSLTAVVAVNGRLDRSFPMSYRPYA